MPALNSDASESRPAARVHVRVQKQDFSLQEEVDALHAGDARAGAVCTFVGLVRAPDSSLEVAQAEAVQVSDQTDHVLWLEHYPGMTEFSIEAIAEPP